MTIGEHYGSYFPIEILKTKENRVALIIRPEDLPIGTQFTILRIRVNPIDYKPTEDINAFLKS